MDRRRYVISLLFRLSLVLVALMLAVRAIYVFEGDVGAWCLAGVFGLSAAALQIRPMLVPTPGHASAVYTPGPAFFLAGLFLVPAGPLVTCIAFALGLSGLVTAMRPHKILFNLSIAVLAYGSCSYYLKLGVESIGPPVPRPELIAGELLLGAAVLVAQLLLRSVAIRLERGDESPHWGAFQPQAVTEALFCLALSVPITVLARIHVALLAAVYLYLGFTWWFMERYRKHLRALAQETVTTEDQRRWVA